MLPTLPTGLDQTIFQIVLENIGQISRQMNLDLRQRKLSDPGLPAVLQLVIKLSESEGSIEQDVLDSITSLTLNLGVGEEGQVLEILQLINVFVSGYREVFKESREVVHVEDEEGFITRMVETWEKKRGEEYEELKKYDDIMEDDADANNASASADDDDDMQIPETEDKKETEF